MLKRLILKLSRLAWFVVALGCGAMLACAIAWTSARVQAAGDPAASEGNRFRAFLPLIQSNDAGALVGAPGVVDPTETATPVPTATATPSPDCVPAAEEDLAGRLVADGAGRVSNRSQHCAYQVGLAAYRVFDDRLSHQQLFASQTSLIEPGQTLTLTVELPRCAAQVDLFYGPLLVSFDPRSGQYYGTRLLASRIVENGGLCQPASPTPPTSPTSTATLTPPASSTPTATPTPMPS